MSMFKRSAALCACCLALVLPAAAADNPSAGKEPPKSWIDPDTGHRVIRLTDEPGSASLYFNDNSITPDGRDMVYTVRGGISVLDLKTLESHPLVAAPARVIVVGRKTPTVYYTKAGADRDHVTLYGTNIETGETRKVADLPRRASISSINADETLGGGTYIEGDGADYGARPAAAAPALNQPRNKDESMDVRLQARLPMTLFTLDLRTGRQRNLIEHSTDWLNHLEFSPTDPTLLLYCHEGPWWKVDRLWTIRTDGTQNTLVHKRQMGMEGVGHEFWSPDGKTIWYDIRFPIGVDFFLGGYNVDTQERIWYHMDLRSWSIHYNESADQTMFCGDGGSGSVVDWGTPENEWIYLLRPERIKDDETLGTNLIHPGTFRSERLVNMSKHKYTLEPNVFFTPDEKYVIFRSNMFGPTYVFAVEVAKASATAKN